MSGPVLDSGGVTRLSRRDTRVQARLRALKGRGLWPPVVPTAVLTEALHGDPRKDFNEERLLGLCEIEPVDEPTARRGARLRFLAKRGSAVDAIVVAFAERLERAVLTHDKADLEALASHANVQIRIERA